MWRNCVLPLHVMYFESWTRLLDLKSEQHWLLCSQPWSTVHHRPSKFSLPTALYFKQNLILCSRKHDDSHDLQFQVTKLLNFAAKRNMSGCLFLWHISQEQLFISSSLNKCPFNWHCPANSFITHLKWILFSPYSALNRFGGSSAETLHMILHKNMMRVINPAVWLLMK
jgi:hypothetical protein